MRFPASRRLIPAFRKSLLLHVPIVSGLCFALSLHAEIILDLTFDDPGGVIKAKPEGFSAITSEFNGSRTTIASGNGGRVLPQINQGPASGQEGKPAAAKVQVLTQPAMGTPAFLHLTLDGNSVARTVSAAIIPDTAATSLSALVTYENGLAIINGGFDFFCRATVDGDATPAIGLWAKCGPLSFSVKTDPVEQGVFLKVFAGKDSLDVRGDTTGNKSELNAKTMRQTFIESGQLYHIAVAFRTTSEGVIAMDVYLQPGNGPMKRESSILVSLENFRVLAKDPGAVADRTEKILIGLSRSESTQTLDLAAFRIFKPLPEVFPGIDGKK